MQSARHKTIQNAIKYKKDADFLLNQNDLQVQKITKFKSIYIENFQLGVSLNEFGASNIDSLFTMSENFIVNLCKVNPNSLQYSVQHIWEKARFLIFNSYLDYTIPSRQVLKRLNERFPNVKKLYRR
jgi:hypothetical protein